MMKFRFLLSFFLVLAGTAFAQEKPAERIISLGPVLTEEIFLLGSADKLIGTTTYCQRPEAAKQKERVGSVQDINIEKIVSLRPDLVLATVLTDPRAKEKLRSLGVRVVDVPNAKDFDGICSVFRMLGKLLGKEAKADLIIADARDKVQDLKAALGGVKKVRVFIQVGVNPLVTIGKGAFINDLIESAGGVNIVTDSGYLQYSREKVLQSDPDVMLISSRGFDGEREKKNWRRFRSLRAVVEDRVFILDEYLMCSPTPVSFVGTLKTIIEYLHPEIK